MCFGGGRAVEVADTCYWAERTSVLMETIDDAKYGRADMQKAFSTRTAAKAQPN